MPGSHTSLAFNERRSLRGVVTIRQMSLRDGQSPTTITNLVARSADLEDFAQGNTADSLPVQRVACNKVSKVLGRVVGRDTHQTAPQLRYWKHQVLERLPHCGQRMRLDCTR